MKIAILCVLACASLARAQPMAPTAPMASDDDDLAEEIDARLVAPPIATVLSVAYRTAGLDHDPGSGFVWRARLAGLVPMLGVRAGTNTSWRVEDDPNIGRGTAYEVRATWRLDRLVFDGRELQVAAMSASRRRERRRLANRVIRAYFTWRRATMARSGVRAEEAAAELDAMTDGWFTEARRTASESRTACGNRVATP